MQSRLHHPFWNKVVTHGKSAGIEVIETALKLYYASRDEQTPKWAKRIVYGALIYFISPIDAIPDILPFAGYTDDLGTLVAAAATISAHIKEEHGVQAKAKVQEWFLVD
ncbi:YkvA family protein [Candidatus Nitrosacidococcus tergens]|uniref:DUF1232 domain-containing protein n=1 Tax=Candidatus Nitrosacidococcus tergens TaxID=553981 RepID=A0A7G1Q9Z0_9GAMM|nr:YkvA family protein [Candidatus Nitrosacidococcus tergens]CAB1276165.1 conserved protein of unknown function [Candidatus Nitrosacidococcus tergens]